MTQNNSRNRRTEFIFLALLLLFSLTFYAISKYDRKDSDELFNQLKSCLKEEERLIDYVKEGQSIYALVNQEGIEGYGDLFLVFGIESDGTLMRDYENDFTGLMPWKLELADVDGDDIQEVLMAVQKTTLFDKTIKNRLFIMNYQNELLVKKWTGSQIAGDWKDFHAGELLPLKGNELLFLEESEDGRERISVFSWFDFGFFLIARSKNYSDIQSFTINRDNCIQMICEEKGQIKEVILKVKSGELIETDENP